MAGRRSKVRSLGFTLSEVLKMLGYEKRILDKTQAGYVGHAIVLDGEEVFTGRASEVWEWLDETNQIERTE